MIGKVTHHKENSKHVFQWEANMSPRQVGHALEAALTECLKGGETWVREVDFRPHEGKLEVETFVWPRAKSNCKANVFLRKKDIPRLPEPRNFVRKLQIGQGTWLVLSAGPDSPK